MNSTAPEKCRNQFERLRAARRQKGFRPLGPEITNSPKYFFDSPGHYISTLLMNLYSLNLTKKYFYTFLHLHSWPN